MGQLLTKPKTEQTIQADAIATSAHYAQPLQYGLATMQGWRRFMEDAHDIRLSFTSERMQYFAVFDGHSGGEVAKYCAHHLSLVIERELNTLLKSSSSVDSQKMCDTLAQAFMTMDEMMQTTEGHDELLHLASMENLHTELDRKAEVLGRFLLDRSKRKRLPLLKHSDRNFTVAAPRPPKMQRSRSLTLDGNDELEMGRSRVMHVVTQHEPQPTPVSSAGTTACVNILYDNTIFVANAGDSRCVLSRAGRAIDLSFDHKPDDPVEKARIDAADMDVISGRVNGCLNLSRAMGDFDFKRHPTLPPYLQAITAYPDVLVETLDLEVDEFLVLACDGIWECLTSQEVIDFVHLRLARAMAPTDICQALLEVCCASCQEGHHGSGFGLDNMTAILILLKP